MRRVSIRTLMAGIVIAAIGLAAIRNCSPVWSGAMLSSTFFTMTCSLLGVAFRRGDRRVYWIGFATLGWVYLLLWFTPSFNGYVGQFLLAPNLLAYVEQLLHADVVAAGGGMQSVPVAILGVSATGGGFGGSAINAIDPTPCIRLGVAIEAFVWAAAGGHAATYFASGRGDER